MAKYKFMCNTVENPFANLIVTLFGNNFTSDNPLVRVRVYTITELKQFLDRANAAWESVCSHFINDPSPRVEFEFSGVCQSFSQRHKIEPYIQLKMDNVFYRIYINSDAVGFENLVSKFGDFFSLDVTETVSDWVSKKYSSEFNVKQDEQEANSKETEMLAKQETDLFVIDDNVMWSVDTGTQVDFTGIPNYQQGESYKLVYKRCDYNGKLVAMADTDDLNISMFEFDGDELQSCEIVTASVADIDFVLELERLYRDGRSELPDCVFDHIRGKMGLTEEYIELELGRDSRSGADKPCNSVGVNSDKSSTIKENYPASKTILSQDKVRNGDKLDEIVRSWRGKSVVSLKLDGVAVRLHYKGRNFVRAESKGKARDVTALMKHIKGFPMTIYHGLPFTEYWFKDKEWFVTGELVAINERRSVAAGYLLRKDADSEETKEIAEGLKFVVYDSNIFKFPSEILQVSPVHLYSQMLTMLQTEAGFAVVNVVEFKGSEQITSGEIFEKLGLPEEVDTDGLVIRINDIKKYSECGETQHHPKGSVAFKFEDEWKRVKPDVIYGRTGCNNVVKLIAEFPPLNFNGKIVKSAVWQPKGAFNLRLNYDRKLWESKRAEKIFVTVRKSENYWQSEDVPFEEHFDVSEIEVCLRGCVIPQWRLIGNGLNKN